MSDRLGMSENNSSIHHQLLTHRIIERDLLPTCDSDHYVEKSFFNYETNMIVIKSY